MRTRPFWPTASRDALVVSCSKKIGENKFMSFNQSIPAHKLYAAKKGDVRMDVKIGGQIIFPDSKGRPDMCCLVQIVDGNLNGWIPSSLLSMLSTQAFPISMQKLNKLLKAIPSKSHSSIISEIEQATLSYIPSEPIIISNPHSAKNIKHNNNNNKKAIVRGGSLGVVKKRPLIPALKFITKLLSRAQPLLVAALFFAVLINRFRR